MKREQIHEVLSNYDPKEIKIGVLGSHSALEMGHGAKQEGFEVVVVCQKGREKTYTKHYKNLFDHILLLDKFSDLIKDENQEKLRRLNTIFVPNRSFSVYTGYDNIEEKFKIPLLIAVSIRLALRPATKLTYGLRSGLYSRQPGWMSRHSTKQ